MSPVTDLSIRDFHFGVPSTKDNLMTKKIKKKQSRNAEVRSRYVATTAGGTGEHDAVREDMDYNGEGGDGPMLDSEEEHEVVPDIDDGKDAVAVAQASPEKTARLPRKKKQDREKGKGKGDTLNPAEDGDFERPRKRHKLRSGGSGDASPGYSQMRSRPATATATAKDSSRSSPVVASSSSPVSSSPETEPPTDPQSLLDHRTPTPAPAPAPAPPPPPSLQRFPLPSRPHAPEKSELASQGLDRALASAQLVDPLLSTPLSLDDENGDDVTGLSARTLRRLRDLGIVELFAGVCYYHVVASGNPTVTELYDSVQTTLLPLFLPPERQKRSLYLPYDPPCDICVSAPTGSGKTLAYVLPIVEVHISLRDS